MNDCDILGRIWWKTATIFEQSLVQRSFCSVVNKTSASEIQTDQVLVGIFDHF